MKKTTIAILAVIAISFVAGIYLYPQMPDKMASHWNAQGEVDGHMPKFWALFLMPIVSVVMFILFVFLPRIDPLKKNIEKFRKYFDLFILLIILFLFYIYLLTLLWSFDYRFDMAQMMSPALGVLFYYIGILLKHAERNWFIGIRTPWTLSSDDVWKKTHELGGKLFKAAGLLCFVGLVLPQYALWFVLLPVVLAAVYLVFYSYFEYKKAK